MKRFRYVWLHVLASVLFLAIGCSTLTPTAPQAIDASAYRYYITTRSDSDTITAMLAYTAHFAARRAMTTVQEYREFFDQYTRDMQNLGKISDNYPQAPTDRDLAVYRKFNELWLREVQGSGLMGPRLLENYTGQAGAFIRRIMDHAYTR